MRKPARPEITFWLQLTIRGRFEVDLSSWVKSGEWFLTVMFIDFYHDDPEDNFSENRPNDSSLIKRALLVFSFLSIVLLGQTFAANINLSQNSRSEFGQGIQVLAACTGNNPLIVNPSVDFKNEQSAGEYYLKSVKVSGVTPGCSGLDFTLMVFGETGSALATHAMSSTTSVAYFDGTTFVKGPGTGYSVSGNSTDFTITFTNPVARSSSIRTFTIQSGTHTVLTCLNGGTCSTGDIGPGGGIIFYQASGTFTSPNAPCGSSCKFLEYAPIGWGVGISVQSGENAGTSSAWPEMKYCAGPGQTNNATLYQNQGRSTVVANTLGFGSKATSEMATNCTSGAGKVVDGLVYGGQSDWFLPSVTEMNELCKFVKNTSGKGVLSTECGSGGTLPSNFPNSHYWTSTESPETPGQSAWLFFMGNGYPDDDMKTYNGRIVPVRAFG